VEQGAEQQHRDPVEPAEAERDGRTGLFGRGDGDPVALALDAAILTGDNDFLGCGCPTWTVETLLAELGPS
jgi:hypothetical protein